MNFLALFDRIREGKRKRSARSGFYFRFLHGFVRSLSLDRLRGCAVMVLLSAGFLLHDLFAPHVLIFGVGLLKIVESEALREAQIAHSFVVAAHHVVDAPLGIGGRARPTAAEELLVFDLERADVALDLAEVVVDSGHGGALNRRDSSVSWPTDGVNGTAPGLVAKGKPVPQSHSVALLCAHVFKYGSMRTASGTAKKRTKDSMSALLREIPSVDELLNRPSLVALAESAGRGVVTGVIRSFLGDLRAGLMNRRNGAAIAAAADIETIEAQIAAAVQAALARSLRRVINATGVVLHTNLGRAPLPVAAAEAIAETAVRYSNLEYDVERGERGKRDVHTARLLAELAGAESAIVVNNNAAAVFLVLNTLAKGAEVIVSRGELIEIGDGFRIPDIMAESGALLREVGTTNRTRIRDYERAITKSTRLLLRVHPSNFRVSGFTERPSLEDLIALGRRKRIAMFEDLGSGCLADLSAAGIAEPLVRASCRAGVALVSFSGDKLLGGPQVGIIAGKKEMVARIRRNPLFRALRVGKLTIAALEATLKAYYRGALDEVPALRMIRTSAAAIARRAESFAQHLRGALPADTEIKLSSGFSVIGGGSTPDQQLPTHIISIKSPRHSAAGIEARLRKPQSGPPVIARVAGNRLILDLRTVFLEEEPTLAKAIISALS